MRKLNDKFRINQFREGGAKIPPPSGKSQTMPLPVYLAGAQRPYWSGGSTLQPQPLTLPHRLVHLDQGVYKVPDNLIFFPTPIFQILIFFPEISILSSYPQQPHYNREHAIASPLLFYHVIFFPTAMIFPFPLH